MGNQLAEERRHRAARYEASSIVPTRRPLLPVSTVLLPVRCRYRWHPQTMDHPSATFNPKWQDRRRMGIKILPPSATSVSRYRVECEKIILRFCLPLSAFFLQYYIVVQTDVSSNTTQYIRCKMQSCG